MRIFCFLAYSTDNLSMKLYLGWFSPGRRPGTFSLSSSLSRNLCIIDNRAPDNRDILEDAVEYISIAANDVPVDDEANEVSYCSCYCFVTEMRTVL